MKILFHISRLLLGGVFIFSGLVKLVDPIGSQIKFNEYLHAMGFDLLSPFSFLLANVLNIFEFIAGFLLFFNVRMKLGVFLTSLLMLFFTPLTLWLAITAKVSDCGCFGDAIKLTDWETFWKNVFLLFPLGIILWGWKKYPIRIGDGRQFLIMMISLFFSIGITFYSLLHLPLLDFRPFSIGSSIPEGIEIPENAPLNVFKTTFTYEKEGVQKKFDETNVPWQDTTWKYVDREEVLISKGYEPPINDFFIEHLSQGDITEQILEGEAVFLLISPKLESTRFAEIFKESALDKIHQEAENKQIPFYTLTSSANDQIENTRAQLKKDIEFCLADEKLLKTIIRTNPGLLLLHKGSVVAKWGYRDIPEDIDAEKLIANAPSKEESSKKENRLMFLLLALTSLLVCAIIFIKRKK